MAFLKYAKAKLQKPGIKFAEWEALRRKALSPAPDFQKRTAQVILQEYDPTKYMLSHATIVASVDVDKASAPLGKHYIDGFEVDRKYADYYVTPKTAIFINSNKDFFERKLLLATFKTFIGSPSYVEHVQIPELSKGRIIDAAARDVGNSIYVDILIANELRHAPLIRAIKSGQLGTLSMGCSCAWTVCSKCGNVAFDESQLCNCVRFFKGNDFKDENGISRVIAEGCGHYTDPNSVRFIEASWVANPAFKGAVLRNILTAEEIKGVEKKMHMAFNLQLPDVDSNAMRKAAQEQFVPDDKVEGEPKEESGSDPFQKAVLDVAEAIRNRAIEKVRKELNQQEVEELKRDINPNAQNESLIKSALQDPKWRRIAKLMMPLVGKYNSKKILYGLLLHKSGGWPLVKTAGFSGKDMLAISRVLDLLTKRTFTAGETRVYETVLNVGGIGPYENVETYLAACRQVFGRVVTGSEAAQLIEKGRLFALGRS